MKFKFLSLAKRKFYCPCARLRRYFCIDDWYKYEKERDKIFIFFRLRGGRQAATLPRVGGLKVSEIKREDALR